MQLPGNFIVSPNPSLGGRPFLAFNVGSAATTEKSRLVDDRSPDIPRLAVAIVARGYGLREGLHLSLVRLIMVDVPLR